MMVDVGPAAYRRTYSLSWLAWSEGRRPIGAVWHCHDDSTINIVRVLLLLLLKTSTGTHQPFLSEGTLLAFMSGVTVISIRSKYIWNYQSGIFTYRISFPVPSNCSKYYIKEVR